MADETLLSDITSYPVSTGNKHALECFNEAMKSFVTLYGDPMKLVKAALQEDPDFLLAHCIKGIMELESRRDPSDEEVTRHIAAAEKAQKQSGCNEREAFYINSLQLFYSGKILESTDVFAQLLMKYPLDIIAIRCVAFRSVRLGTYERARDTIAWVVPFWNEDMEYYPHMLAFYSFALEETNEREKAKKLVLRSLDLNPAIPWAHHCMSHVVEECGDVNDGIVFLNKTREDWTDSHIGNHINWHLTLYYLDLEDMESVFQEYDTNMSKNIAPNNFLALIDASSLLWRLEAAGVTVGEDRSAKLYEAISAHAHDHLSPWFDAHVMMGLAYGKVTQDTARLIVAESMITSMKKYSQDKEVLHQSLYEKLGVPVCSALLAYGQEKYDEVLQTLLPLRFDFIHLGGSWAQRQVFIVTLIEASIKANKPHITKGLLGELKARKPKSNMVERYLQMLTN